MLLIKGGEHRCTTSLVEASQVLILELLLGREEVVVAEVWHRETQGTAIVHADSSLADGLRRDDDDPCSRLSTVERRGRGILEDGDTLDGVHIHIIDVLDIHDRPVDDEEREVSCTREGSTTTEIQLRACIGVRAEVVLLDDLQTRDEGLEALQEVFRTYREELL